MGEGREGDNGVDEDEGVGEDEGCGGDDVFEDEGREAVRNEGLRIEGVWEISSEDEE